MSEVTVDEATWRQIVALAKRMKAPNRRMTECFVLGDRMAELVLSLHRKEESA